MPRVFLNYRREDSAGIAGRLFDRLCVELGRENVFRDLDTLMPGVDFAKVIADQVASCDALIAVIGKDWLIARDGEGHRRLDQPGDLVKTEIREALARDKLVIPALVEGASLPKAADLPPDIAELAARNAIEISDSGFAYDTERLIRTVQARTDGAQDPRSRPAKQRRWWAWVSDPNRQRTLGFIGAGVTAAAIAGWTVYVHLSDKVTPIVPPKVSASNGGIATGGDVTANAGPGGTAIVATAPVTIGISLEQYEAGLKHREQEVLERDKEKIALLEKELAAVEAKRQNPEQALSDFTAALADASQALEKLQGDLPTDQIAEARQALGKGDTAAAEALLTEALAQGKAQAAAGNEKATGVAGITEAPDTLRAQAAAGNEKAAEAAFQLGELAYQRIDYARAYDHYLEAAKLQPDNPEYLNMADRIAYDMGRYAEANTFYEKAPAIRENVLGSDHPDVGGSLNNLAELYPKKADIAKIYNIERTPNQKIDVRYYRKGECDARWCKIQGEGEYLKPKDYLQTGEVSRADLALMDTGHRYNEVLFWQQEGSLSKFVPQQGTCHFQVDIGGFLYAHPHQSVNPGCEKIVSNNALVIPNGTVLFIVGTQKETLVGVLSNQAGRLIEVQHLKSDKTVKLKAGEYGNALENGQINKAEFDLEDFYKKYSLALGLGPADKDEEYVSQQDLQIQAILNKIRKETISAMELQDKSQTTPIKAIEAMPLTPPPPPPPPPPPRIFWIPPPPVN